MKDEISLSSNEKSNPLDGVLALAQAIRKGSKRQRLSHSELVERTEKVWSQASKEERKAMMIVGAHSPIFDPKWKAIPTEDHLILQSLGGPEPNQDAKISLHVDTVLEEFKKKSQQSSSSKRSVRKMKIGNSTVIYDRNSFGARAEAVLADPETRKSLFQALKRQRVTDEK